MKQMVVRSPLAVYARALKEGRERLGRHFPAGLFQDPSLEILLDLFVTAEEGRQLQVSAVCLGAGVPATTALRYIAILERHGLVARQQSPTDRRSRYLTLTPDGDARLRAWLGECMPDNVTRLTDDELRIVLEAVEVLHRITNYPPRQANNSSGQ